MATSARVALQPNNEAARQSGKTGRATAVLSHFGTETNNTTALRLQRLRLIGVIGQRAETLTSFVWGEAA
jgi:hypothetical protein